MPLTPLSRRRFGALALAAVAAAVTACGSSEDASAGSAAEGGSATAGATAFPVTVDHVWGSTTIPREPQRVVVLGATDADAVLGLGVTPVAIQPFFADYTSGVGPWAQDLVAGKDVTVLPAGSDSNVELIASLRPDLVVAVSSGFEQSVYDQLSKVAPTIVRPAGTVAYGVDRTTATREIGKALGRSERAEELIATADAAFTDAVAANPGFTGATGAVLLPYSGKYGAYTPVDARGAMMAELGFTLPAGLAALDDGTSFFVDVSSERLDLVDGDVLVVLVDSSTEAAVASDAVLQQLPVTRDGGLLTVRDALRGAMSYNTVLSAPYAVQNLAPMLAQALGDR